MTHDTGTLLIDGLDPRHESDRIEIRRRLGYLPQTTSFPQRASVFDVVDYLAVLKGFDDGRHRRQWVFHVLELVGLADRATDRVETLSEGLTRRLALAQAMLGQPALVILDEPAAGLDPDARIRIRDLVSERRGDSTVVLSTHLTDEAAVCDTIVVLDQGSVRFVGSPTDLASVAEGRTWIQTERPDVPVRASWRLHDGRYRCLGMAPQPLPQHEPIRPTLEDGYLVLVDDT